MGKVKVLQNDAKIVIDVLRYFEYDGNKYVIFGNGEVDDSDYIKLHFSKLEKPGVASKINDEAEWVKLKELIKIIVKETKTGEVTSIKDQDEVELVQLKIEGSKVFKLSSKIAEVLTTNKNYMAYSGFGSYFKNKTSLIAGVPIIEKIEKEDNVFIISFVFFISSWSFAIILSDPTPLLVGVSILVFYLIYLWDKSIKNANMLREKSNIKEITKKLIENDVKISKHIKFEGLKGYDEKKEIHIILDNESKKIVFCNMRQSFEGTRNTIQIVNTDDIIKCEILEDNSTIMEGGVGRALVGGVLAGGAGALVGSTTRKSSNITSSLKLRVITKDIKNHLIVLEFINNNLNRDSERYKSVFETVQEMYSLLISVTTKKEATESVTNAHQRLKDLKSMLDDNLITKEEYDEKKIEFLNNL